MSERRILPSRRRYEALGLTHGNHKGAFQLTVSFYPDGDIGEIFVTGAKTGSDLEAQIHDTAIAVFIVLQYGALLAVLTHAMPREENGTPSTVIGRALDILSRKSGGAP
jgi:ribonucleoside-diphosphate reductase alpha chain